MKYRVGDKVKVRQLEDMVKEFGLGEDNEVSVRFGYTSDMEQYCGKTVTIAYVYRLARGYSIEEDGGECAWSDDMFEVRYDRK